MGEEYGEPAPFQFFTDHIDEQIAQATREGRRREFAAFADFDEEIPDPQDPATFERSKLTRRRDPDLADLYAELLRRAAGACPVRWRRSSSMKTPAGCGCATPHSSCVCNFAARGSPDPDATRTWSWPRTASRSSETGSSELPPLAGALLR